MPTRTATPLPPSSASEAGLASSPWDSWLADVFTGATDDLGAVAQGLQAQGCAEPLASLLAATGWLRHHRPSDSELTRSAVGRQALAMFRAAARANSLVMSTPSEDGSPNDMRDNTAIDGLACTRVRLTASAPKVWLLDDVLQAEDCKALTTDAGRAAVRQRIRPALQRHLTALAERFHGAPLQAQQLDAAPFERTAVVLLAWPVDHPAWLRLPSLALACRVQQGGGLLVQLQGRQGEADALGKVLFRHLTQQLNSHRIPSVMLDWAVQA